MSSIMFVFSLLSMSWTVTWACVAPIEPSLDLNIRSKYCSHVTQFIPTDISIHAKACQPKHTHALRASLANGMFGGADGVEKDCTTSCVFNIEGDGIKETHFRWSTRNKCWAIGNKYRCKSASKQEKAYATNKKASFCAVSLEPNPQQDACTPAKEINTVIDMAAMCPTGSGTIDRSPTSVGCSADTTTDIQLALANGMFGFGSEFRDCNSPCLYSLTSTTSYRWNGECWTKRGNYACGGSTGAERQAAKIMKDSFCPRAPEPTQAPPPPSPTEAIITYNSPTPSPTEAQPTVAVKPDEYVDGCIQARTEAVTSLQMDQFCSHDLPCQSPTECIASSGANRGPSAVACDAEDTFYVQIALANGMFGGAAGLDRDCSAWCLFDLLRENTHFTWRPTPQCWQKSDGYECGSPGEGAFAVARKAEFCEIPVLAPPVIHPEDSYCVQVRRDFTTELMDHLCAHEQPCVDEAHCPSTTGTERGPAAVGCDPNDTENIHLSLVNGLFGAADGTDRDCGAYCLFDYITPYNVVYRWEPSSQCWRRKQGNTAACGGTTARNYAVERQAHLCPPTMAPTVAPTFTMPPTSAPSNSPTSSFPTTSPSTSPTVSSPTFSPSNSPTVSSPTFSPSLSPSTSSPTLSPSLSPSTSAPTISPTFSPSSSSPTLSPSVSPTTSSPSISPTTSPTQYPTTSTPTGSPTLSPSVSPSVSPSIAPTVYCVQYTYQPNSVERVQSLCGAQVECVGGACRNAISSTNWGPGAQACDSRDQEVLHQSIANGMFGKYDNEQRDCSAICVWDVTRPTSRSYKWKPNTKHPDGGCWKRLSHRCGAKGKVDKEERQYAYDRYDLFCTRKAPHQQVEQSPHELFLAAAAGRIPTDDDDTATDDDDDFTAGNQVVVEVDAGSSEAKSSRSDSVDDITRDWLPAIGVALWFLVACVVCGMVWVMLNYRRSTLVEPVFDKKMTFQRQGSRAPVPAWTESASPTQTNA